MEKNRRENLKKKDICKNIHLKIGISQLYADKFLSDTIKILTLHLKKDKILKINGFGSFKILNKSKRIGRNPKTNQLYEISERKSVSFKPSIFLKKKINNE